MNARFQRWRGLCALVACITALAACGQGGGAAGEAPVAEGATPAEPPAAKSEWTALQPGLEYRELTFGADGSRRESPVHVLRIDPAQSELVVEFAGRDGRGPLPAGEWCRQLNLAAAINVGMFLPDQRHVGYARDGDFVSNPRWVKSYQSALAFGPRDDSLPAMVMVDLDEDGARDSLDGYDTVVQNLRLIKAPGANVWSKQEKRWSEAALATDGEGRLLMIFSRAPFTMWELNRRLIASPLGIVRAMHVEGGPEASLSIRTEAMTQDFSGNYETGFFETETNTVQWSIPNILGVRKK